MKTLNLYFDTTRPPWMPTNGNRAVGRANIDAGYLVVGPNGELIVDTVYFFYEQAVHVARVSERVIARKWYERETGVHIEPTNPEEVAQTFNVKDMQYNG